MDRNGMIAVKKIKLTRNELLLPRVCPATVGLSGKERELDLF